MINDGRDTQAIIVIYNGKMIDTDAQKALASLLVDFFGAKASEITMVLKDSKGIAETLLRDQQHEVKVEDQTQLSEKEALEQAIIYIGEKFETDLSSKNNDAFGAFAFSLAQELTEGRDENVRTAVEIIATTQEKVSKQLCVKYKINSKVLNLIKICYNRYKAYVS